VSAALTGPDEGYGPGGGVGIVEEYRRAFGVGQEGFPRFREVRFPGGDTVREEGVEGGDVSGDSDNQFAGESEHTVYSSRMITSNHLRLIQKAFYLWGKSKKKAVPGGTACVTRKVTGNACAGKAGRSGIVSAAPGGAAP
jgi:hypothetical protein